MRTFAHTVGAALLLAGSAAPLVYVAALLNAICSAMA
jgi:hypothetical protein